MKFLLFCLILTILHTEIFSHVIIQFDTDGNVCEGKRDTSCGKPCYCDHYSLRCQCPIPDRKHILRPCYDNKPYVDFGNVKCKRMRDQKPEFVECKVKCLDKYILYGAETLQCRGKDLWGVDKLPLCLTPGCERLWTGQKVKNAVKQACYTEYKGHEISYCEVTCKKGFVPENRKYKCNSFYSEITCDEDPRRGKCQPLKEGEKIWGLKIDKCVSGITNDHGWQDECSFHCENGFEPDSTKIKCDFLNRYWVMPDGSTNLKKCEATYHCKPIPKVPGRRQKCQTVSPGKPWNCTFSCENGYFNKEGLDKVSCSKKGQWQGKPLVCEPSYNCKPIPEIPERNQECVNVTIRKPWYCNFKCEKGYIQKEGRNQIYCNKNGQWQGKPLVCEKRRPGKCKQMLEGEIYHDLKITKCVSDNQHGHKWQSECTVHCICDSPLDSATIKCDFLTQEWVSLYGSQLPKCDGQ